MPKDPASARKRQIPTNLRLLLVIETVAKAGVPVTAASLGEALDLPKPTIHRLLATAEEEGFVQRDLDGRSYEPGPRTRALAEDALTSQRMQRERLMVLRALVDQVGETCNLAAPGRHGMVYLDRVETDWPLRIQLPVGTEVPFFCTASGKMYLSSLRADRVNRLLNWIELAPRTTKTITDPEYLRGELAQIRSRGFSTDNEEFMEGTTAVAVPINDSSGRLLSTISIHAPVQRHSVETLMRELHPLREAATRIEGLLRA